MHLYVDGWNRIPRSGLVKGGTRLGGGALPVSLCCVCCTFFPVVFPFFWLPSHCVDYGMYEYLSYVDMQLIRFPLFTASNRAARSPLMDGYSSVLEG